MDVVRECLSEVAITTISSLEINLSILYESAFTNNPNRSEASPISVLLSNLSVCIAVVKAVDGSARVSTRFQSNEQTLDVDD